VWTAGKPSAPRKPERARKNLTRTGAAGARGEAASPYRRRGVPPTPRAAARPGLAWDLRVVNELPPVETPVDAPLVRAAQEAAAAVTGERRPARGAPYYTDGATLAPAFGLPMVICGPGDPALAHQTDEWAPVDQLVQAAELYARLAWHVLAARPAPGTLRRFTISASGGHIGK